MDIIEGLLRGKRATNNNNIPDQLKSHSSSYWLAPTRIFSKGKKNKIKMNLGTKRPLNGGPLAARHSPFRSSPPWWFLMSRIQQTCDSLSPVRITRAALGASSFDIEKYFRPARVPHLFFFLSARSLYNYEQVWREMRLIWCTHAVFTRRRGIICTFVRVSIVCDRRPGGRLNRKRVAMTRLDSHEAKLRGCRKIHFIPTRFFFRVTCCCGPGKKKRKRIREKVAADGAFSAQQL